MIINSSKLQIRTLSCSDVAQAILKSNLSDRFMGLVFYDVAGVENMAHKDNILHHLEQLIDTGLFNVIAINSQVISHAMLRIGTAYEFRKFETKNDIENNWGIIQSKHFKLSELILRNVINKCRKGELCIETFSPQYDSVDSCVFSNPSSSSSAQATECKYIAATQKHPLQGHIVRIVDNLQLLPLLNIALQDLLLRERPLDKVIPLDVEQTDRPWGKINVISEAALSSVRILHINSNMRLSFQRHVCRDELFISQSEGTMIDICYKDISIGNKPREVDIITKMLRNGERIMIRRGTWHRLKAPKKHVNVVEIGYGPYDQENDIERREDDYGRLHQNGTS